MPSAVEHLSWSVAAALPAFSRSMKAWKLVMTMLARPSSVDQVRRHEVALAVVVVRVVGQQHAEPVADRDPRRHDEERVARTGCPAGWPALLSACQAMSIAMTTVLPDPVAILSASRDRPALYASAPRRRAGSSIHASPTFVADLGEVDRRLERLDLAEEQLPFPVLVGPVLEQPARGRRHVRASRPAASGPPARGCG